uniref:Uncharacterized protein n=1 Tax=Anguilla anguilla TaxID=7936 RepID=A0A0E9PLH9_ANGAN
MAPVTQDHSPLALPVQQAHRIVGRKVAEPHSQGNTLGST